MRKVFAKYKTVLGVLAAFIVGVGGTSITTALIPDMASATITACKNDTNGSLRVVGAGTTCDAGETSVVWSGTQNAVLAVKQDPNDLNDYVGIFDVSHSRDITSIKRTLENVNGDVATGFCIDLAFDPLFISQPNYNTEPSLVSQYCGSGYKVFLNCSAGCVSSSPFYFSN